MGKGMLALRPAPFSVEDIEEWGSDLVLSMWTRHGMYAQHNRAVPFHVHLDNGGLSHTVGRKANPSDRDWEHLFLSLLLCRTALKAGLRVVIHCRVGLHRSGILAYVIFRCQGYGCDDSLRMLRELRPMAEEEMMKTSRNRPNGSAGKAEAIYQALVGYGFGDVGPDPRSTRLRLPLQSSIRAMAGGRSPFGEDAGYVDPRLRELHEAFRSLPQRSVWTTHMPGLRPSI